MMKLLAIDIDQWKNQAFAVHDECRPILDVYPDFYVRAGFILNGVVVDEEDGDVWEWEYKRDALSTSV